MADLFGLFDPATSDEPIMDDLDDLLSASAFLEKRPKKAAKTAMMPPRSRTTLDLSAQFRFSSAEMANLAIGTVRVRTRIRSSLSEGDFHSLPPEPQQGIIKE